MPSVFELKTSDGWATSLIVHKKSAITDVEIVIRGLIDGGKVRGSVELKDGNTSLIVMADELKALLDQHFPEA